MARASRQGAVLALVVLALMALELLAHGALLLARQELAASLAGARLLQARAAAEAGYRESLAALAATPPPALRVGAEAPLASGNLGRHPYQGRTLRLSREAWHVAGEGRAWSAGWGVGFGGPAWILDPGARLGALAGVVEVVGEGAWELRGSVTGFTVPEEAPPPGGACDAWDAFLDSLRAVRALPTVARVEPGGAGEPSLGLLGPQRLAEALAPLAWAVGTPRPSEVKGVCDLSALMNLGDPEHPDAPCADHLPALWRAGDATLEGGVGQGLLAVSGDLVLSGARWEGVLLAGGRLTLRDGARLLGAARAGALEVDAASGVTGSACRVLRALEAARRPLGRPLPMWAPIPLGPIRP